MNEELHAWFSPKAADLLGYALYERFDGTKIAVTCVDESPDPVYLWEDKQYLGIVVKFISAHETGRLEKEKIKIEDESGSMGDSCGKRTEAEIFIDFR